MNIKYMEYAKEGVNKNAKKEKRKSDYI